MIHQVEGNMVNIGVIMLPYVCLILAIKIVDVRSGLLFSVCF